MIYKLICRNTPAIGNFVFHLCHAILLAKYNKCKLIIPVNNSLKFLYSNDIVIDFREHTGIDEDKIIILNDYFIHPSPIIYDKYTFYDKYTCINKYFLSNIKVENYKRTDKDTLVIHIRSGDIFKEGGTNTKYAQPPLSYYTNIINTYKYTKIIILTNKASQIQKKFSKNLLNPVVKPLLEMYSYIELQNKESLEYDFGTLCNCYNLVISRGSFSNIVSILNKNLINLYIPIFNSNPDGNFGNNMYPISNNYNFNIIKDSESINYGNNMYYWKNTEKQRSLMTLLM